MKGRAFPGFTPVLVTPVLVLAIMTMGASPALAHGFAGSGWLHPLTGPDHMLAMLLVGAWSAQLGGRALWVVPTAFVLAMAAGAGAAIEGIALPWGELAIALSIAVLGIAIALARPIAVPVAVFATLLFGWAHGAAHGLEAPAHAGTADLTSYIVGFLVTTAGLHIAGLAGGQLLLDGRNGSTTLRLMGTASSAVGIGLYAATAA